MHPYIKDICLVFFMQEDYFKFIVVKFFSSCVSTQRGTIKPRLYRGIVTPQNKHAVIMGLSAAASLRAESAAAHRPTGKTPGRLECLSALVQNVNQTH